MKDYKHHMHVHTCIHQQERIIGRSRNRPRILLDLQDSELLDVLLKIELVIGDTVRLRIATSHLDQSTTSAE